MSRLANFTALSGGFRVISEIAKLSLANPAPVNINEKTEINKIVNVLKGV